MTDPLLRLVGWRALFLQGDPLVYDRFIWLRRHLRPGPLRAFQIADRAATDALARRT
jgi:hypothetical protein